MSSSSGTCPTTSPPSSGSGRPAAAPWRWPMHIPISWPWPPTSPAPTTTTASRPSSALSDHFRPLVPQPAQDPAPATESEATGTSRCRPEESERRMQQAQDPGHVLTEGLEPDHPAAGPQRAGWANSSLRTRMIGAVLVAGVATVAVGAFGINRMSALSEAADVVYAEGTVPVDSLRKLQVDWWELQTHIARSNIEALPPESRASSQDKGAVAAQTLTADVEAAADLPLSPDAAAAFGEFAGATQQYLTLVGQLQQIVTEAQEKAAAAAAQ